MYADDFKFSKIIDSNGDTDLYDMVIEWCLNNEDLNIKKCSISSSSKKKLLENVIKRVSRMP